jgi:hypothetical protein
MARYDSGPIMPDECLESQACDSAIRYLASL